LRCLIRVMENYHLRFLVGKGAGSLLTYPMAYKHLLIMRTDQTSSETTICKTCGFCCDGTFFTNTPVNPENQKDQYYFIAINNGEISQPCNYYGTENGCRIYKNRPKVCARFKCRLLSRFQNKKTSLADSISIIEKLKKQRTEVIAAIDDKASFIKPTPLKTKFILVYSSSTNSTNAIIRENAEAFLAKAALTHLIKKYFLPHYGNDSATNKNKTNLT